MVMRDNRTSEVLLHFIWQYRYYNNTNLVTEAGAPLAIEYPGDYNTCQGPDFKDAQIKIGDTTFRGPVELHIKASDWHRHHHDNDPHYQHTILHVVWENDTICPPADIPILALRDRTSVLLISRYRRWMTSRLFVPCASLLPTTGFDWPAYRQTLVLQRLRRRTAFIRTLTDENNTHWEELLFWLIARSLGQPVNTDAFLTIARSLPFNLLLRRRTDPDHLERLFLLQTTRLTHPISLFRMRPAHSPFVRLRQLAGLLTDHPGRFATLLESEHPSAILDTLTVNGLGRQTKQLLLINAFIPLLFAYGCIRRDVRPCEKALHWLGSCPPENNSIIRRWRQLGLPAATAADTQALLELKRSHCDPRKCLQCDIGKSLLGRHPTATGQ
jgi:hypothetical protein